MNNNQKIKVGVSRRRNLFVKFILILIGIASLIILAMIFQFSFLLRGDLNDYAISRYQEFNRSFGKAAGSGLRYLEPNFIAFFIDELSREEEVMFVRIITPQGSIYFADDRSLRGSVVDIPKIDSPEGLVRDGNFEGETIKEIFSPFTMEGRQWVIWLGLSLSEIESTIFGATVGSLFLIGAIVLLGIGVIFYSVFRFILVPLDKINSGIVRIAQGRFDQKIELKTKDEFEDLANSFNQMAKELGRSKTALEEAKTVLEIKVEARTRELKDLTENLDEQVKEKTKEVQEKMKELERFNRLAVGREMKMVELKEEIKKLKKELKKENLENEEK